MNDLKRIRKEFFKLQKQLENDAEKNDEKCERIGVLIEKAI